MLARLAAATLLALPFCGAALADTATLTVTAQVQVACTIEDATLSFGAVPASVQSAIDASASMNVDCLPSVTFLLSANGGNNQNVTTQQRQMTGSSGDDLAYDLYRDAARTQPLNDVPGTPTVAAGAVTIYGRIPSGQSVSAGSYSDSVVVQITF